MSNLHAKYTAVSLLNENRPLEALEITGFYPDIIKYNDPELIFLAATAYFQLSACDEAITLFKHCLSHTPERSDLVTKLCKLYQINSQPEMILDLFGQSTVHFQNSTELQTILFGAIIQSGQIQQASKILEMIFGDKAAASPSLNFLFLIHLLGNKRDTIDLTTKLAPYAQTAQLAATIILILRPYMSEIPLQDVKAEYQKSLPSSVCPHWLSYQLYRYFPQKDSITLAYTREADYPIEQAAFQHAPLPKISSVKYTSFVTNDKPSALSPISIDQGKFTTGITSLIQLVQKMKDTGAFQTQLGNIELAQENLTGEEFSPLFILSSGRAGTTAIHHLFKKSEEAFSYHSYQWQINSLDMNHILYRILIDKVEGRPLEELIIRFVEARTAEIIFALVQNKTPVFTGHWDTIFAPIWHVLFPKSRFIYMHRDVTATFKSSYEKNQWYNNQLQPLCFNPTFPNGLFYASDDPKLGVTEKLSWFYYITHQFSTEFSKCLETTHFLDLKSENLFSGQQKTLLALKDFLDMPSLTTEKMADHYSTPINQKSDRIIFRTDTEEQIKKIPLYFNQLEETGMISPIE